jgi:FKBP-type peptidyl-prolyl cis-trans isomerase SlyD
MKSAMKITPNCVVSLTWTLKDTLGDVLDELDEPVDFLLGGRDLLAKIEAALQGFEAGATLDLHLEPEDAFGDYDEMRVYLQPRNLFPAELETGMTFDGIALPAGSSSDIDPQLIYTVTDIYPEHVVLDGNHPLAGIAIRLSLKVEEVREATDEERARGSVGAGFFRLEASPPGNGTVH